MKESKEILLSISILMSGRKETRKCLNSLKSIMEAFPCELILVDTGCDDNTREILEEYTDIIVPFEWCNDFSKARNAGLELAKGKWFMFLDDDEWFVDTSEIIDFFASGEYEKYRCASYVQRNYHDMKEGTYSDYIVTRMTQIFDNTRFESSIHECLKPLYLPVKTFSSYVKHFGYVNEKWEDRISKSNRNLLLLEEEIKKNPYDYRLVGQILQEYRYIGEYDSIIKLSKDYINKSKDSNHIITSSILGSIYGFLLDAYLTKYRFVDCLECVDKIKKDDRINDITKAFIYRSEVISYYNIGKYKKVVEIFKKYMLLFDLTSKNYDEMNKQQFLITELIFQQDMLCSVVCIGIMSELKLGKDIFLKKYFNILDFENSERFFHEDFVEIIFEYILTRNNYEEYVYYIEQVIGNKKCLHQAANYIEKLEFKMEKLNSTLCRETEQDIEVKDDENIDELRNKFEKAICLLSKIDNNYWYFIYLKVLNYRNTLDSEECIKNIEKLFSCVVDKFNIDNKVWDIVIELGIDFSIVAGNTDFDSWRVGIDRWVMNATQEDVHNKEKLVCMWENEIDYRYLYLKMKVDEARLRKYSENDECIFNKLEDYLFSFINSTYEFCTSVYNESVLNEHTEVLLRECALAIKLLKIKDLRNIGDNKEVIRVLKECVDIYEPFNSVIKLYVQKLGEEIKQEKSQQEPEDVSEELAQLATALKLKVREFIENGNIVEARVVLNQLIQCVPDDEEAKEILLMLDE